MRWWPLPWPKAWAGEKPSEDEDDEPKTLREQVLLFARDLAFAFIIVAIVMGLLFGYTRVWPPMVVVESDSMQHSDTEGFVGVIDTGDLVLVQTVSVASDVTTYVEARNAGYETYSNYGDVIVFNRPFALPGATPIIHRAIVYVVPNTGSGGVDVPSLAGRPVGVEWDGVWVNGTAATTPSGLGSLTIKGVRSWDLEAGGRRDIVYSSLNTVNTAGFFTKGDHNQQPDQWGQPVAVGRIVGKARGELPWFGLIKLTLSPGPTGCCRRGWGDPAAPANSWNSLLVSLILVVVGPFAADFGWGWWKDRRKERKSRADASPPKPGEGASEDPGGTAPPTADPTDDSQRGSAGPGAGVP